MALMSGGSTPGRGPHGAQLNRAIDYLLANAQPAGSFPAPTPIAARCTATALPRCSWRVLRHVARPELREKSSRRQDHVNCQNKEGGWRYQPVAPTPTSPYGLRGDGPAGGTKRGLFVPNETIDRAIDYVKRSQNADGGFMYMLQSPGESLFPRSARPSWPCYSAGVYKGPEITKGLDYLMQFIPTADATRRESYYFYGHYYAVQAMWQAGGQRWSRWYPAVRDDLIARQRDDGSWLAPAEGNECATADGADCVADSEQLLADFSAV